MFREKLDDTRYRRPGRIASMLVSTAPQLSWNSPSKELLACHTVDKQWSGPHTRMSQEV